MSDERLAVVLLPGEGRTLPVGAITVRFLAVSEDTDGASSVEEFGIPGGFEGPPLHIHDKTSHAWYVLEGEVRLTLGTDPLSVRAGGFVYVPAGLAHTFANVGSHPARMVQFTTPGGFERYLAELTEAFPEGTAIDPQAIAEIMARHDTRPLPAGD